MLSPKKCSTVLGEIISVVSLAWEKNHGYQEHCKYNWIILVRTRHSEWSLHFFFIITSHLNLFKYVSRHLQNLLGRQNRANVHHWPKSILFSYFPKTRLTEKRLDPRAGSTSTPHRCTTRSPRSFWSELRSWTATSATSGTSLRSASATRPSSSRSLKEGTTWAGCSAGTSRMATCEYSISGVTVILDKFLKKKYYGDRWYVRLNFVRQFKSNKILFEHNSCPRLCSINVYFN